MATKRGIVAIFGSRNVNLVVLQSVNKLRCRYFHKCVECGRIHGSSLTILEGLKNVTSANQRKAYSISKKIHLSLADDFSHSYYMLGYNAGLLRRLFVLSI
jgi:hypothetical protein